MSADTAPAGRSAAPLRDLPLAEQTLPSLLERQAARHGERPFVATTGGERRSFAALRDAAARWAGMLQVNGVERGDRVAAIAGNRIELVELIVGCAWLGAIAVPLNTALCGAQLRHALGNSAARVLVIEEQHLGALESVPPPATLEHLWLLDGDRAGSAHGYELEPLPALGEPVGAATVGPGDTLAILYTSGTTGVSKGVCCPHAQLYWWGVINSEFLEIGPQDVCFTTLPLFHTNAINSLCQALVAGAAYVTAPRFTATRYWQLAREHGATRTYLLGAMVNMLLAQPPGADGRSHRVTIALAPGTPAALHAPFAERFGVELRDGFGSTETNHITGVAGDPVRPGSLGRALDEFELAVVDAEDRPLGAGEPGELVVRARHPFSIASGYFGMPAETAAAWRGGWFHTGDRVVRDAEGWFRFVDRTKDAIRRRGENISSFEVEQALLEHPAVGAAAVFPVPSELAEDEVMAAIVPAAGAQLDPLELIRFCEPRIAYFAIPRYIDIVAELPLTENGKVRKADLRERGVSDTTWDLERTGYRLRR